MKQQPFGGKEIAACDRAFQMMAQHFVPGLRKIYDAYVAAGWTEQQAMELTVSYQTTFQMSARGREED